MPFDPLGPAHACSDAQTFEREILDQLAVTIGFDVAFFAVLGDAPSTVGLDAVQLEQAFVTHRYDDELLPLKRVAVAHRGVAVDTEVFGESAVRAMAYHRELAAPAGGRHSMMAYLILRGRPLGALMLGRSGSAFARAHVEAVAALLPSIIVGRASFHVPWFAGPLSTPKATSLRERIERALNGGVLARTGEPPGGIVVRDRDGYREMVASRAGSELVWTRARIDEPHRSGWFYVDLFHLAAARARHRRSALFIGAGGAVAVRQFAQVYPGMAIDLVDIDPQVVTLANDWYALGSIPGLSVRVDDGAAFIAGSAPSRWDVVVVDAYDGADLPAALASRAFLRDVRRVLRPGGCLAFNVIGSLRGGGPVQDVARAARAELEDVRLVPVLDPDEAYDPGSVRNVVLLASG